ncbi:MAG: hypothetical protein IJD09_00840 [Clostridia bacterium]|nr:hypothetical protein [Clostridia bacterium]
MKETKRAGSAGFWERNRMLLIGLVGVVLLISFFNVKNVILSYETPEGEKYAIRMDYTVFDMCMRCVAGSTNAGRIVEMDYFIGSGKEESVEKAIKGLWEIAGTEEGVIRLEAHTIALQNEKETAELVDYLVSKGYNATAIE